MLARDLATAVGPRLRLAVLSACGTASGSLPASEGPLSMARAFLAAGVDAVVGSQQPIRDDVARKFSIELHRALAGGASPAAAVRAASERLRADGIAAEEWSSFIVIGGSRHVLTD